MIKNKVKYVSVNLDTAKNESGEVYNMLFVNFTKGDKPYRINEFFKFAETVFLNSQYGIDFDKIQSLDISKYITSVEVIKDKNRYGEKKYLNVHFECGYDKKIPLEDDHFYLINTMYRADTESTTTTEIKK